MDKIIIYKDGKKHYIPTRFIGYNDLVEVNGSIISNEHSNFITSVEVKTLRLVTKTVVPVEYVYGTHTISVEDYDKRIEFLQKNFKEKIDETIDDEGDPRRVCIWTNKDAEVEFYTLTHKYKEVTKPIFKYGDYLEFEIVSLPKSSSKFIIPDWKTTDAFGLTCTFNRKKFLKETADEIAKNYPTLKMSNYLDNYKPSMYINNHHYDISNTGNFSRASYKDCVDAEKALRKELEEIFKLELGKTKENPLCNATTTLNEVNSILSSMKNVQTKVATIHTYQEGINKIIVLKKKLETEVLS